MAALQAHRLPRSSWEGSRAVVTAPKAAGGCQQLQRPAERSPGAALAQGQQLVPCSGRRALCISPGEGAVLGTEAMS